jgi:hypothetical protein
MALKLSVPIATRSDLSLSNLMLISDLQGLIDKTHKNKILQMNSKLPWSYLRRLRLDPTHVCQIWCRSVAYNIWSTKPIETKFCKLTPNYPEAVYAVWNEIWSTSVRSDVDLQPAATNLQYPQLQNPDLLTACFSRSCSSL